MRTNGAGADGEVVWSWRPDAGVKFAEAISADDGGKQARSPGRARRKPLKPLRRECRVFPVWPWWLCSCAFYILHARLRARRAPGIPCALWCSDGQDVASKTRAHARRDREAVAANDGAGL